MNGTGERFKKEGFNIPKPLLPLGNERLLQLVKKSYPKDATFIHIKQGGVRTSGPLETVLLDFEKKSFKGEILIADCDSFFEEPSELWNALEEFRQSECGGGVTVRRTTDPGCSYATVEKGFASDFREKDRYTEWSTTGPYYWKEWTTFYRCALKAYWNGVTSISPVYNYLKAPVRAIEVSTFVHLGTPDAYLAYCRRTHV